MDNMILSQVIKNNVKLSSKAPLLYNDVTGESFLNIPLTVGKTYEITVNTYSDTETNKHEGLQILKFKYTDLERYRLNVTLDIWDGTEENIANSLLLITKLTETIEIATGKIYKIVEIVEG